MGNLSIVSTILIILTFQFLQHINCSFVHFNNDTNEHDEYVRFVIQKLFSNGDVLLFIYEEAFQNYLPSNKLLNVKLLMNVDNPFVKFYIENRYNYNYIIIANENNLRNIMKTLESSNYWNDGDSIRGKYAVFLYENAKNRKVIFEMFWQMSIINVFVFELDENFIWNAYSYNPFSKQSKCGELITPKLHALKDIKPKLKPKYLKHCKLNVSLIDAMIPNEYFNLSVNGVMLRTFYLFSEKYDINITYFSMPIKCQLEGYGKTVLDILVQEIFNKTYDVIAASVFRFFCSVMLARKTVEFTEILFYDEHVWYLPKTKRVSNIKLLLIVLPSNILIIVLFVAAISFLIWHLICKLKHENEYNKFRLLGLLLGFSVKLPKSKIIKLLFIFYIFCGQHINYFFQGNLSSKLTIPQYEKRIKTIDELLQSNYLIKIPKVERDMLLSYNTKFAQLLYDRSVPDTIFGNDRIEDFKKNQSNVACGYKSKLVSSNHIEFLSDDILSNINVQYILRVGNPILHALNEIITKIKENGFLMKWSSKTSNIVFDTESTFETSVVTMEHLQSVFIMLLFGLILGASIFVAEVFYNKIISK